MPKVWSDTIEAHRRVVRDAILDTTGVLASEHGLLWMTMSHIAEEVGIGRATLYKYFPDVESILVAWHERQITDHVAHLAEVRDRSSDSDERLRAVLEALALIHYEHPNTELSSVLQGTQHASHSTRRLREFLGDLLTDMARLGRLRTDVVPDELAGYCFHALTAAGTLSSKPAVRRLVKVTLTGLKPQA